MTDERKPLAPDRPGRYLLRNGQTHTLHPYKDGWGSDELHDIRWIKSGESFHHRNYDITARAPDDAAWCLEQARLLCPEGYAVVPVEPTEAMQSVGCDAYNQYGRVQNWKKYKHPMTAACYRAMIASAAQGK